ncbi:transglutaminase family protein [Ferrovum myxofaciens]|uniref:Transglutaminase family protein n=1 Tax=Ferrovum myxofaciens TaxID=416213 RepID=A0A9E6SXF3_9PROT|nr:transglutaminase family protein [Ferrovum myxofaciens]QKE39346.1 MAG: transglutaminase family protein [Ferrovum myxofaciens]QWY74614.1 MAG: transglutaminase family protein [Ferrovum myxofaciens]QWY77363.1 MAG: transglutaminase family protein [Ferrovum myxofaciens]
MQRLHIKHLTEYLFPTHVILNPHRLLLRPREGHDVRIETSKLVITPAQNIKWHRDVFDNSLAIVNFLERSDKLTIASEVIIQHYAPPPYDFLLEDYAVNYPFSYSVGEQIDLAVFQHPIFVNDSQIINDWLKQQKICGMQTFGLLVKLNQAINSQFHYQMREEAGVQSPAQTLAQRSGSCRDYATLFIEACRCLGFASRFVSGYLHSPATEAGFATTHAWVEIYLPGTGWKGFDPTSGEVTGNRHIAVAVARDPETVPPVSGSFIGSGTRMPRMQVNVQVSLLA